MFFGECCPRRKKGEVWRRMRRSDGGREGRNDEADGSEKEKESKLTTPGYKARRRIRL
jgi:hypothetical protein